MYSCIIANKYPHKPVSVSEEPKNLYMLMIAVFGWHHEKQAFLGHNGIKLAGTEFVMQLLEYSSDVVQPFLLDGHL